MLSVFGISIVIVQYFIGAWGVTLHRAWIGIAAKFPGRRHLARLLTPCFAVAS